MRTSTRILLNAATQWITTGINIILGLVLVPFLITQLGQEGYGLIALLGSLASVGMFANLGLSGALSRHLAEQIAVKNDRRFNELASTALVYFLIAGSVLFLVIIVAAPLIVDLFQVSANLQQEAIFLVRWYSSIVIFLTLLQSVFTGIITSSNQFAAINTVEAVASLSKGIGLFVVLGLLGAGLIGWAAVLIVYEVLITIAFWQLTRATCPMLSLRLNLASKSAMRSLFGLGSNLFLMRLARLLGATSDPIVISAFLGPSAVATYTPALTITGSFRPLIDTLSQQMHPVATSLHVTGQVNQLQTVLTRGTRLTFLMGVGACVFLAVFSQPIMRIWLGSSLGSDYLIAAQVLFFWAIIDLTNYAAGTQWPVLLGMNRVRILTWTQVLPAILNVILSVLLVAFTNLGVIGVVIPTLVISLIRRPLLIVYTAHVCGMSSLRYFQEAYKGGVIILGLLTGLSIVVRQWIHPDSLLTLSLCGLICAVIWAYLTWAVGLKDEDKALLHNIIYSVRSSVAISSANGAKR